MKDAKGLTLVEVLVVIAIIAILAGIVIVRMVGNRYDVELDSAANILQSNLVKAREMARSPKESGTINNLATVKGYGVILPPIDSTNFSFSVFKDVIDQAAPANENKWVDPVSTSADDAIISTTVLSDSGISNIKLSKYLVNGAVSTHVGNHDVLFGYKEEPSQEKTYYLGSNSFNNLGIMLEHTVSRKKIIIYVNSVAEIFIGNLPVAGGTPSPTVGSSFVPGDPSTTGEDCDSQQFFRYPATVYPSVITTYGERQNCSYPSTTWTNVNEVFDDDSNPAVMSWPNGYNDRGYIIADYGSLQDFNNLSVNFWTDTGIANYPKAIIAVSQDGVRFTTVYFHEWPYNSAPRSPYLINASIATYKPRYVLLYYIMSGGMSGGPHKAYFDGLRLY